MIHVFHDSTLFIAPVLLIALSSMLHLVEPHYRASTFNRVRLGQLSAADAERAATFVRWSAPILSVLGCLQLSLSWWHSLQ